MLHEKNLRAIIVPHMTEVECFNHGGNVVTIKEKMNMIILIGLLIKDSYSKNSVGFGLS